MCYEIEMASKWMVWSVYVGSGAVGMGGDWVGDGDEWCDYYVLSEILAKMRVYRRMDKRSVGHFFKGVSSLYYDDSVWSMLGLSKCIISTAREHCY